MQKIKSSNIFVAFFLILASFVFPNCNPVEEKEEKKTVNKQELPIKELDQWQDDRLSLFVHYGVYSSLAGTWNDEPIDGAAEEIWATSDMFVEDYEKVARNFDPKEWDARSIVSIARDIGMRTIILTAKHLDGFCLFSTETTSFNIVDFTHIDRDIMAEMAEACKTGNIKLSLRFSLTDWHLPAAYPMSKYHATPVPESHHRVNLQQIEELLTNYGDISEIYFHSGFNTPEQSRDLRDLIKKLQPQCLISNGIGNNFGDFISTAFNQFPAHDLDVPWIMPASIDPSTLAYHEKLKNNYGTKEKAREKVRELVDVISKGGNFALNIGPKGNGSTGSFEEETLNQIGRWIKVNRKAVFGTKKNPFDNDSPFWKITHNADKLYIFVDSVPSTEKIKLTGLKNKVASAQFLGSGIEPEYIQKGNTLEITWTSPAMADPMQLFVIEVELTDTLHQVPEKTLKINPSDTLILTRANALTHQSISSGDKYSSVPSVTAIKWNIEASHVLKAEIKFSSREIGRNILLETSGNETLLQLKGQQGELISSQADTVQTGTVFRSKAFYGAMDEIHVNPNGNNRLQIAKSSWMAMSNNSKKPVNPLPMTAHYYYVEIDSENQQKHCYEISGNDGLQVWLNNEELILSRNTTPEKPIKKHLVLDLQEGKNILLIKNYNRKGSSDMFNLTVVDDARWYSQFVTFSSNPEFIKIKRADNTNPHEDINLINFSIILTPEK